ncbi:BMP family ABC transporter substrate-binding protein [Sinanaerobacter chloroacetimidivorans]|jgi:basic membrane protein A|uniref:BMP family ABC transporter substrate-binding protein n=1 Tax=Sinanaerobacter chloroacetimidivorans TaxID=2818044 RepID=A0A8J7W1K1_9FIRM|nr:BMP family ABC transporter substrate-binding protein [Sinanaerobacter chloroacetimidivorans]MBR0597498.1 BMP family ABC transporter substrate-binding protein [Sinanaerobacter chloroacetimidivorans]
MKKFLAVLLVLVLAISSFTGCGGKGNDTEDPTAKGEPELTVGFIYIGPKSDGGFSEAQDRGRQAMEDYFDGKVATLTAENVPEEKQEVKSAALNMMDQGAKVIIGTSFGYMDTLEELAQEYPDTIFIHFSGNKMNDTNFGNYFGAMEEPRYLAGIVAGMMTKSNKIGYVAAFPYTELLIGINAFTLGARSVNPDAEVKVVYTNAWVDAANEKAAAEALLAQGCDVLEQHCDTTGPQIAAEAAGAYAIGYNMDSREAAPGAFLTAPIWHHEAFYIKTVQEILDGTWKPESYYGTMADGYVDLAELSDLVTPEAAAKVAEVRAQIEAGEHPIFVGPIKDNTGKVRVQEGETLDRAGIWSIDYLVEGATGASN